MLTSLPRHFRKITALSSIAILLFCLVPVRSVRAQATGNLVGQVFDEAGTPLPAVRVTITNIDSGNSFAVVTDSSGIYRRPFLFPGKYRITAFKDGFTENYTETNVPLAQTTEIKPPAITIRSAAVATTTQPTPTPTNTAPQAPLKKESDSSLLVNKTDA